MKDIEITAFGSFEPGEYGKVEVDGVGKCSGPFSAQCLEVNGVLNTHGAVRCDKAEVNGTLSCVDRLDVGEMEINGAVKVDGDAGIETLEVNGALNVHGKLECTSLACDGALTVKGGISADAIDVDGALTAGGQVSADHIHVEGVISAGEVVGDEVVIWNVGWNHNFHCVIKVGSQTIEIGNGGNQKGGRVSTSRIGLIEATTIALQGVEADTVNGTDVTIGPGCVIDHLDCNGTLSIDPAARVGNITGEYTMVDK